MSRTTTPAFRIHGSDRPVDGAAVLRLEGSLDADAAPHLTETLQTLLEAGSRQVRLDFSGVGFLSSAGIGSLIASIGEFRDEGGEIVLDHLSSDLLHVLEMLGLMDYVLLGEVTR